MKRGYINLVDLDFEYKIWKNRLELFRKEVKIILERNEEVKDEESIDDLPVSDLERIEEHEKELTHLFNRIKVQEQELHYYNKDFPITPEHQFHKDQEKIRTEVEALSKKHLEYITYLMNRLSL
jgi:hypothetical protein